MLKLTWKQAAAWRIRQQCLSDRAASKKMLAVASRLCGFHAQVLSCAELTAWARTDGLKRDQVQKALWMDRTLVKTWAMRGTLHLLPSSEIAEWHAALRVNPRYLREQAWKNYLGITLAELDQITEHIGAALHGKVLTREELSTEVGRLSGTKAFESKVISASWGVLLKPAAFTGLLCFAENAGTRVRFTHPTTWLATEIPALAPEKANAAIARRFLSAYAPATLHDLARWWGGGGVAGTRRWLESLGDEIATVDVEGEKAFALASDIQSMRDAAPSKSVSLLPGFDQYVVTASRHAAHLFPGDVRGKIYRPQGWISPVLLVDGFMLGTWKHELKGSSVDVAIEPFIKVPAWVRRGASQEAERLADFLGAKLRLNWKD